MDCSLLFRNMYPFYLLKWYYKATLLIHISKWLIRSHLPYKTVLKNRQTFWVDRKFRMPTLLSAIVALEFCRLKKHKWAGFWGLKRKPEYVRRAQSCAKVEFFQNICKRRIEFIAIFFSFFMTCKYSWLTKALYEMGILIEYPI